MNRYYTVTLCKTGEYKDFIINDKTTMKGAATQARASPGWSGARVVAVVENLLTSGQPTLDS